MEIEGEEEDFHYFGTPIEDWQSLTYGERRRRERMGKTLDSGHVNVQNVGDFKGFWLCMYAREKRRERYRTKFLRTCPKSMRFS